MERCWCFHFISPAEINPCCGCDTFISSLFGIFQEPGKHPAQAGLPWAGSVCRLTPWTAACSALREHQNLLSHLSLAICLPQPGRADKQQLAVVLGGRPAWSVAGVWRHCTGHMLKSATHSSALLSAWNCQVTATAEDNKLKQMWNVGETGRRVGEDSWNSVWREK